MPKILRYAAFAEEVTYGVQPTPTPNFYADIASSNLDTPQDTELEYEGGISRGLKTHRPGFYAPSGNVVYADSINTIMRALRWALGGYVFTGDSPLNVHESYAVDEQLLPSFACRIGKDVFEHQFFGCVCDNFELAISDGFAQLTLDVLAQQDKKAALNEDAIDSLEATAPFVFHEVTINLAGSDASAKVKELTIAIKNGLDSGAGRSLGSRFPRRIPAGSRRVTLSMTMWYEDTAQIERVWGDATGPVEGGSTELPVVVAMDAGVNGTVDLEFPRVIWTSVSTTPSGQGRIEQTVNATCYLDDILLADAVTTVRSEMLATTINEIGDIAP